VPWCANSGTEGPETLTARASTIKNLTFTGDLHGLVGTDCENSPAEVK
jgi:hypothetical protein